MHTLATLPSFVDTLQSAEFLGLTPRRVLDLARAGKLPFYPLGTGQRRIWRFRLSELAAALSGMAAGMGISVPNEPRAGDRKRMRLKGKQLPRSRFRIVWDDLGWFPPPFPCCSRMEDRSIAFISCAKTFFARIFYCHKYD
jgi:Helix-turn-helix domain